MTHDSDRSESNAEAYAHGATWEAQVGAIQDALEARGVIRCWQRNAVPWRQGGRRRYDGTIPVRLMGATMPDWVAILRCGWLVVGEDKHTSAGRLPLSAIRPHQAGWLSAYDTVPGCTSVLLVRYDPPKLDTAERWCLPWSLVRPRWERWYRSTLTPGNAKRGTASLSHADLARLGAQFSDDWTATIPHLSLPPAPATHDSAGDEGCAVAGTVPGGGAGGGR